MVIQLTTMPAVTASANGLSATTSIRRPNQIIVMPANSVATE